MLVSTERHFEKTSNVHSGITFKEIKSKKQGIKVQSEHHIAFNANSGTKLNASFYKILGPPSEGKPNKIRRIKMATWKNV